MTNEPYLSVVVTSRNDDHGGDPLVRLQALLRTFSEQCRRTGLAAELLVVEWNPPSDKPRLRDALPRPEPCYCDVRFVEVPAELHNGLAYSDVLPLYQMIAKNVGVRRARGQYVLATNIDIIFSDQLIEHIARRQLEPGVLYRLDRHDIESAFPVMGEHAEQMAWCEGHQLRLHQRWGTYPVTPDGRLRQLPGDVVRGEGVRLGSGWHVLEKDLAGSPVRWASERVELVLEADPAGHTLEIDVEPHPWARDVEFQLELLDSTSRVLLKAPVRGAETLRVRPEAGGTMVIQASGLAESRALLPPYEVRDGLAFRVRRIELRRDEPAAVASPGPADQDLAEVLPAMTWTEVPLYSLLPSSPATTIEFTSAGALHKGPGGYLAEWQGRVTASGTYTFRLEYSGPVAGLSLGVLSHTRARWLAMTDPVTSDLPGALSVTTHLYGEEHLWLVIQAPSGPGGGAEVLITALRAHGPAAHELIAAVTPISPVEDRTLPLAHLRPAGRNAAIRHNDDGSITVVTPARRQAHAASWTALAPCAASFFFRVECVVNAGDVQVGVWSRTRGRWLVAEGVRRRCEVSNAIELSGPDEPR